MTIAVFVLYASLAFELLFLAVPSEASTWQVMRPASRSVSPVLGTIRSESRAFRLVWWALPTGLGIGLFLLPLATLVWPALVGVLGHLPQLARPEIAWIGIAIGSLGRALSLAAIVQLRRCRGSALEIAHFTPHGLYGWSRNPGLVGMYAFYLGLCFVTPCLVLWLGALVYGWNMDRRVRIEEQHLRGVFGATFESYCSKVPRYLGVRR